MAQIDEDTGMTQQHMQLEAKWLSGEDVSGDPAYSAQLYPKGAGPIRHEEAGAAVRDWPVSQRAHCWSERPPCCSADPSGSGLRCTSVHCYLYAPRSFPNLDRLECFPSDSSS